MGAPQLHAVSTGPQIKKLKKGELLFAEGENSRAMYLLRNGMIRLYKKKGDTLIELDTVHTGQVLGELAFLDGNPRSASGEALTDCELIEISGPTFQQILIQLPDWLKILLKTIVGRLRSASTRIRQLESASMTLDYSEKDGKRSPKYIYLSPPDCLKICSSLLLVGTRNSSMVDGVADVRISLLHRYANQIMGVPLAKVTSLLDILAQAGIIRYGEGDMTGKIYLKEVDFLEKLITYMNEENLLEPAKRHDVSARGFAVMSAIAKHLGRYPTDEKTGLTSVNVAEIKTAETVSGKEPFRMEEFQELVKLDYASNLHAKSTTEVLTFVKAENFLLSTRLQRVIFALHVANEQKNKASR